MNYIELLKNIMVGGQEIEIRGEVVKELNFQLLEIDKHNIYGFESVRSLDKIMKYEKRELAWYFSGSRQVDFIKSNASLWGEILNPDKETINSNYGYLVYYKTNPADYFGDQEGASSFNWALENLLIDKNTRKAVVLYNDRGFNFIENKDYICSQYQHFFIRDNKLHCAIGLRSSDAIYGLTFNMPWWSIVQQDLRLKLLMKYKDLRLGNISAFISSAHIYKKHWKLVENMIKNHCTTKYLRLMRPISTGYSPEFYYKNIDEYVILEDEKPS